MFYFTPGASTMWIISGCQNIEDLTISDPSQSFEMSSRRGRDIVVPLAQGVTYRITASVTREAGDLTISAYDHIALDGPGSVASRHVYDPSRFYFTPGQSGIWIFQTTLNVLSDPALRLYSMDGTLLARDDSSGTGLNALIRIQLEAGETIVLEAGFYDNTKGEYLLEIWMPGPVRQTRYTSRLVAPSIG